MKQLLRILSLLAAVAMAVPFASAETHYKPRISFGARGGMSLGSMTFSPSVKQKWTSGSTGALTFRYTEEKLFGLVAELGWVQRGWEEDFEGAVSYTHLTLPTIGG